MTFNPNFDPVAGKSPAVQLFVSILIVFVIGSLLFSILILAASRISGVDPTVVISSSPESGNREAAFIRFTLVAQDLSFFIVPGIIILTKFNPGYTHNILSIKSFSFRDLVLVAILSICAFPVTSIAGQFNSGMTLPHQLSGVEHWMRDKEDFANQLMELLMAPGTIRGLLLNLMIMACIPAFGEELIFRGVFQKVFHNLFRSGHLAVWVTSIIFSAIHVQFYGFLPRLILGLIFGYLFLWTNSLWLPVTAHFMNNAVPTVYSYIKGWETINETAPAGKFSETTGLILSLLAGFVIMYYFRERHLSGKTEDPDMRNHMGSDY